VARLCSVRRPMLSKRGRAASLRAVKQYRLDARFRDLEEDMWLFRIWRFQPACFNDMCEKAGFWRPYYSRSRPVAAVLCLDLNCGATWQFKKMPIRRICFGFKGERHRNFLSFVTPTSICSEPLGQGQAPMNWTASIQKLGVPLKISRIETLLNVSGAWIGEVSMRRLRAC
jgi:hypothetical protein